MRKTFTSGFFFLLIAILPVVVKAQEDKIFLHSGKVVPGKVLKIDDQRVNFLYLGVENLNCAKYSVEKVEFAHGTVEPVSKKIVVSTKDDWEKVIIFNKAEDVAEMKYKGFLGDIKSPVTPDMILKDKSLERKIKEQAAEMGCPFVLVNAKKNVAYNYN